MGDRAGTSALYGASAGLNIAMVEEQRVGGTCLHRGCIPAKELLQTAEVLRTVGRRHGVRRPRRPQPTLDLGTSQTRKQQVVDRLTRGLEGLLSKGRKVTVVPGTGSLVDAGARRARLGRVRAPGPQLILATGSLPRAPSRARVRRRPHPRPTTCSMLDEVPGRVLIIGGGAIGCEFASFLIDVGSDVTLVEALPQILTGVDVEVGRRRGPRSRSGA